MMTTEAFPWRLIKLQALMKPQEREREGKKKKTESGKVNYLTLQSVFYEQVAPNCAAV